MRLTKRKLGILGLRLFDLSIVLLCFVLAGLLTYSEISDLTFSEFMAMRIKISNFLLFIFLMLTASFLFSYSNLYRSHRLTKWHREAIDVIIAVSLCTLIIMACSIAFSMEIVTKSFLVIFWILTSALLLASHFTLRHLMRNVRLFGRNLRYALILGTNQRALEVAKAITSNRKLGYQLTGFVDNKWFGNITFEQTGYKVVSDLDSFQAYLRDNIVDEVFICTPLKSQYEASANILSACEEQGVTVHLDKNIFTPTIDSKQRRSYQEEDRWLTLTYNSSESYSTLLKRMLDVSISLVMLVFLLPLFLVIALLIKLDSPGPVFFVQQRIGLNKRRFGMRKFRTMVADAEKKQSQLESQNEVSGPVFKMSNDPRITSIGKILRSTSLDELPQLINVLMGDMALVGPRPLPIRDFNGFEEDWYRRRFSVLPGITCLWQIEGRSDISFDEWMQLDMRYIDQWSLWLDIKILFKTIPAVLRGSGAY